MGIATIRMRVYTYDMQVQKYSYSYRYAFEGEEDALHSFFQLAIQILGIKLHTVHVVIVVHPYVDNPSHGRW